MPEAARQSDAPPSDGMPVDIGADRLATVYARAIIEAADRRNCRREVLAEIASLVREVLPRVPRIGEIFASPRVATDRKEELIGRITDGRMLPTTIHSLRVLARHDRLGLLADVLNAAERLADDLEGRRQATFTTAVELDAGERERLVDQVQRALGVTLAPRFAVDPALIGGLVVRIDDTVYDQSVSTSLRRLGHRLKKRSIHEIQYGRDRLGSA